MLRRIATLALVCGLVAILTPIHSAANAPVLTATPAAAMVGQAVAFAFSIDLRSAAAYSLHPGSSLPIAFGDGATDVLSLDGRSELSASTTHAYARAGVFVTTVQLQPLTTVVSVANPSVRVVVTAPLRTPQTASPTARPSPSPIPTTRPSGTTFGVTALTLRWPDGSGFVEVRENESIPHAIARVSVSAPGSMTGQWSVDGSPQKKETKTATQAGQVVDFDLTLSTPPTAQRDAHKHTVGFTILSPSASGGASPTPAIAYSFVTAPAAVAAGYDALQFDGFLVTALGLKHIGSTYSGTGTAHIADLSFPVAFSGLTLAPDTTEHIAGLNAIADVTAGSAGYDPPSNGAGTSLGQMAVRHVGPAPCDNSTLQYQGNEPIFSGEIGHFHRFAYVFSLMSIKLEALGTHSTGSMCYAPANVETGEHASEGFNIDAASETIFGGKGARQLALDLGTHTLDQNGQFQFDLGGAAVPSWRVGYSVFASTPSAAAPFHFLFNDGSSTPHVVCDGTHATGHVLQQIYFYSIPARLPACSWQPDGVYGSIEIKPGAAITSSEPFQFEIVFESSSLAVQASAFLGGPMSGEFYANRNAPIPVLTATASGTPAPQKPGSGLSAYEQAVRMHGDTVGKSAAYNRQSSDQSQSYFLHPSTRTSVETPAAATPEPSDPSGSFSGSFTSLGDLVASAKAGDYLSGGYSFHPLKASLFVAGGQTSYGSQDDFKNYLEGMAGSQAYDPNSIPGNINYSQPETKVISDLAAALDTLTSALASAFGKQSASQHAAYVDASHLSASKAADSALLNGPTAVTTAPEFAYPGLYVAHGAIAGPGGKENATFDVTTSGGGWGFAFTDGGGTSAAASLQGNITATFQGFTVDEQLFNILIFDGSVIRTNIWGGLQIPAPIAANIAVSIQQLDAQGNIANLTIPAGTQIPLTGWNASLAFPGGTTAADGKIEVNGATLSAPGLPAQAVYGALQAGGSVASETLYPAKSQGVQRIAGLDYEIFSIKFPDDGKGNAQPTGLAGLGSIAGWSTNHLIGLTWDGNQFSPPPGLKIDIAQSAGSIDFNATVGYANQSWNGRGQMNAAGFVSADFGFKADNTVEHGWIGANIGQADGGGPGNANSAAGPVSMANIAGEAGFDRNNGSLLALALGANLNLAGFSGNAVLLYDTATNDPLVQQYGGIANLAARGYDCAHAWCFEGSLSVGFDAQDSLAGEVDATFNGAGFGVYVNGQLNNPFDKIGAEAQFALYDDGEWDFGIGVKGIPILGIADLNGSACVWNHKAGQHPATCLDNNFNETNSGFYIKAGATKDIGDIGGAAVVIDVYFNGAVGGDATAHGSMQILGVGPSVDASLGFASAPFGFHGTAAINFCACLGSIGATVGVSWYDAGGFHVDSGGVSLGGPCGACAVLNDALPWNW